MGSYWVCVPVHHGSFCGRRPPLEIVQSVCVTAGASGRTPPSLSPLPLLWCPPPALAPRGAQAPSLDRVYCVARIQYLRPAAGDATGQPAASDGRVVWPTAGRRPDFGWCRSTSRLSRTRHRSVSDHVWFPLLGTEATEAAENCQSLFYVSTCWRVSMHRLFLLSRAHRYSLPMPFTFGVQI